MATSQQDMTKNLTFRLYEDGDQDWKRLNDKIFKEDTSHKCPVYVQRTPPCQGSCPSGHDIRGWLDIVRGIEKPPADVSMQEYAFRRATEANPFPSVMGRVCPAPCEDGCNRNDIEEFVGINSVEQYIGDTAIEEGFSYGEPGADTGSKVAVIGGGPGGVTAAQHLRLLGHAVTLFDDNKHLGGLMRYGIPNYRIPRDKLEAEINRVLDLGVETRLNTRVGVDVSVEELDKEFDAVVWAVGLQKGRALPIDGWEGSPNCVDALAYLKAFNQGRMKVTAKSIVCIGGGDTSIDVVSVARRLGYNPDAGNPEDVVLDASLDQAASLAESATPTTATLTAIFSRDKMFAQPHEIKDADQEGVDILDAVMPLEVIVGDDGRATGLKVCDCTMDGMKPVPVEGTERIIEADLIVSAIGQFSDLEGFDDMANDRGLFDVDKNYQVVGKPNHFAIGDILRPHLLTTAIGHATIAVQGIDQMLKAGAMNRRPKVDKHHFDLMDKLEETGLSPDAYNHVSDWGTGDASYAVHNFENRAEHEVIESNKLFLGHFEHSARILRGDIPVSSEEVLGHFEERSVSLDEENAVKEAERCMSCGMCFECDNCVIYCPQDAVFRVKKDESTLGRYVATDYSRCIGCHICADVCPTGYIDMAMGE